MRPKIDHKKVAASVEELKAALRTFIKSGSANGNEPIRKRCLMFVETIGNDRHPICATEGCELLIPRK